MKKIILITLLGLMAATSAMAEDDTSQWQQEQMPYADEATDDGADQATANDDEASGSDLEEYSDGGEANQPMNDDTADDAQ